MITSSSLRIIGLFACLAPAVTPGAVIGNDRDITESRIEKDPLVGTAAGKWSDLTWLSEGTGTPRSLSGLEGRVTVIRWWTAPGCPYCRNSAPALTDWHRRYAPRGLQVLGFYHHKSPDEVRIEDVKEYAGKLGFNFPVAIDKDWQTLRSWWLDRPGRKWTSVTFVIDHKGIIRGIHPGGEYIKGYTDPDYLAMDQLIQRLINELPAEQRPPGTLPADQEN
jgi:peroxiredoxin